MANRRTDIKFEQWKERQSIAKAKKKRKVKKKKCSWCWKQFTVTANKAQTKYCSAQCRKKALREKTLKNIAEGKVFLKNVERRNILSPRMEKTCFHCGEVFNVRVSEFKNHKFCSRKCVLNYLHNMMKFRANLKREGKPVTRVKSKKFDRKCSNFFCDNTVQVKLNEKEKFCCVECKRYVKTKEYILRRLEHNKWIRKQREDGIIKKKLENQSGISSF